jgi:D-alanine transaminase
MSRIAYVNGRYVRHADASVHVEDRGFQFADAIYEVWALMDGRLADSEGHFTRLERSLSELEILMPLSRASLTVVLRETVRRNRVRDGLVYLQISRGQARRDHVFPDPPPPPTVVVTVKPVDPVALDRKASAGTAVITAPDIRWGRCDIKTTGLLPNAMAKTAARRAGAGEVWFTDQDGRVTEGGSTNAWIVDAEGVLRTRDEQSNILRGVTRANLLALAEALQMRVETRPFTVAEAQGAREAFFTAASAFVTPVTSIDGVSVGDGKPGPVAERLRRLYMTRARSTAL